MEQSPHLKSNLNSEMSDLIHQAEEWAQMRQISCNLPHDPRMEGIFRQVLQKASMLLLEKSGVKTVEEFQNLFGPMIAEQEMTEKEEETDVIEIQRDGAVSPIFVDELQNFLKHDWSELLEEPLSFSPFNCRRRTSMFSDLNVLSPIVSESSQSPEKIKKSIKLTPSQTTRKSLFNSMQTPKTPWRRGNSMYVEDVANTTMVITPQKSLSFSRLSRLSPAPLTGEPPLENRASRLRRMKIEEKMRENELSFG